MRFVSGGGTLGRRGPEEWFVGRVWMDPSPPEPPEAGVFRVAFEPGARTNWHAHPEGQILHVITGKGRAGTENGDVIEMRAGDSVTFAPGERHWHGAAPDALMVHLAVNPAAASDGGTEWMEPVTDEEYGRIG